MTKYYGLDWIGTVLGLASIYYLGRKRRAGFILRIAASVFWIAFGFVARTAAGVIANLAVILLSLHALKRWTSSEKPRSLTSR
jgi:hypothetical protein